MLTVTPTGQVLGATIAGLDLSQPLSHPGLHHQDQRHVSTGKR
jgi:hypothetical protein